MHQFLKELDEKIKESCQKKEIEVNQLQKVEEQARLAQQLIQKINSSYHPYNLEDGSVQTASQLDQLLRKCFNEIKQLATEAQLPSKSCERINKAERPVSKMVATQNFYLTTVQAKVEALSLQEEVEKVMKEQLIPAIYLDMVADKAKDKEQRQILRQKSEHILQKLNSDASPLRQLCQEEVGLLQKVAYTCAGLFQRSSSCVEGRNGQLSLRYHNLHRISQRRLAALTAIHNYAPYALMARLRPNVSLEAVTKNCSTIFCLLCLHLPGLPKSEENPPPRRI